METFVVPFLITYGSKYATEYALSGITTAVVNKAVSVAKDKVKNEWYKISKKNKDIVVFYEYVDPNIEDDKIIYVSSKNEDDTWDKMSTELKEFNYNEIKNETLNNLKESFMTANNGSYDEDRFLTELKNKYNNRSFMESICLNDDVEKEFLFEDLLCTPSTGIVIMPAKEMDFLEI